MIASVLLNGGLNFRMPRYFMHLKSALQSIDDANGLTLGSDGLAICLGFVLAKALFEDDTAWLDFRVIVTDAHEQALACIPIADLSGAGGRRSGVVPGRVTRRQ